MNTESDRDAAAPGDEVAAGWRSKGSVAIGSASLLADAGHEIPTALLPSLLTSTLGAPAAALGIIEGIADGLAGAARLAGGAIADDPVRRRASAVGGYTATAVLSAAIGAAANVLQVGVLRAGAWAARGLRVPSRNALLADAVPALLILRATELLTPTRGVEAATSTALALYLAYNIAATGASFPAGRASDRRGSVGVLAAGAGLFTLAYTGFAVTGPNLGILLGFFVVAGVAIGCIETAQHAAIATYAPAEVRGSAFGLLAATQAFGNLAASSIAGLLWTLVSPAVAFGYAAVLTAAALVAFLFAV